MMKKRYLILILFPLLLVVTGCPPLNKLPVWTLIPDLVRNIGQAVNFNLLTYCTDPDGDPLTFSIVSGPGTIVGSNYTWTVAGPIGPRVITVRASDGKGHSETSFTITVKGPPNVPSNPSPANNAINQNYPNVTLSWTGGDPDGDAVTYDLYFGTASNPPLHSTNLTSTSFVKGSLQSYTKYYWKIVAKDGVSTTTGPIWNFTTRAYQIVNDNFETRPLGQLAASTLPWGTYDNSSSSYGAITNFGYGGSKGLTFYDPTIDGFARVLRTGLSPARVGVIKFDFRVSSNGVAGVGDRIRWAPYVFTGDWGSGFGLYTYNYQTGIYTKLISLTAGNWYTVVMEFNFNAPHRRVDVYVDNVLRGSVSYSVSFDFTQFEFIVYSDKTCGYVDFDNVLIGILQPGYTTSEIAPLSAEMISTDTP